MTSPITTSASTDAVDSSRYIADCFESVDPYYTDFSGYPLKFLKVDNTDYETIIDYKEPTDSYTY